MTIGTEWDLEYRSRSQYQVQRPALAGACNQGGVALAAAPAVGRTFRKRGLRQIRQMRGREQTSVSRTCADVSGREANGQGLFG